MGAMQGGGGCMNEHSLMTRNFIHCTGTQSPGSFFTVLDILLTLPLTLLTDRSDYNKCEHITHCRDTSRSQYRDICTLLTDTLYTS